MKGLVTVEIEDSMIHIIEWDDIDGESFRESDIGLTIEQAENISYKLTTAIEQAKKEKG